jgi:transposase-like protein
MRYPASEKLEIIRIVEQSHLPAKRTLDQLGIARRTFYRWYDRFLEGGPEALEDRPSAPTRVWNRIGDDIQDQIVEMALDYSELSPRELAVRFTDEKRYFVSEATVYRLLKAHDLITSPAYVVIKAADQFHTKTTRPNEMWQTDFTYCAPRPGWSGVHMTGMQRRKEELNECLALCCEGA